MVLITNELYFFKRGTKISRFSRLKSTTHSKAEFFRQEKRCTPFKSKVPIKNLLEAGSAKGRCCRTCPVKPICPGKEMKLANPRQGVTALVISCKTNLAEPKGGVISVKVVLCRVGMDGLIINPYSLNPSRIATFFPLRFTNSSGSFMIFQTRSDSPPREKNFDPAAVAGLMSAKKRK